MSTPFWEHRFGSFLISNGTYVVIYIKEGEGKEKKRGNDAPTQPTDTGDEIRHVAVPAVGGANECKEEKGT